MNSYIMTPSNSEEDPNKNSSANGCILPTGTHPFIIPEGNPKKKLNPSDESSRQKSMQPL
jgi:hypothetical protein